jgi:Ca-activated chloride channel family protein
MHFLAPAYLWLLLAVAALAAAYLVVQLRRKQFVARFSNTELLGSIAPRRPGWRRHLTFALLLIALLVLSLGVAKPATAVRVPRDNATVILAIDVSLSMEATDVLPSRIAAAKAAGKHFVALLPKRINLGLVSFGGTANLLVPPTLDRHAAKVAIGRLHLQTSTAIGEAIFTSLAAIRNFSRSNSTQGSKAPPARIVLLSDGTNTVGRPVSSAVRAARRAHVEVSTIAFGTPDGTVTIQGHIQPVPADTQTLSAIARDTGGSFHTAASEQQLRSVYANIGSQIGYTTQERDISWRFALGGLLCLFVAGAASLLWSGRLA